MVKNIDELMDNVYQKFLDLYQQEDASTAEVFLAFEPIGQPIDLDSFKINPTDTAFSREKAKEEFTELTDDIPVIDADIFRRTNKSIEETYGSFILYGATPGTKEQGEIDLFEHLKDASERKFEGMKVGKIGQRGVEYRPAYANPEDWYDPSQTSNWTHYTYYMEDKQTSSQGRPPQNPPQSPSKKGPKVVLKPQIKDWSWQVLPKDLSPVITQPDIIKHVSIDETVVNRAAQEAVKQRATAQTVTLRQPTEMQIRGLYQANSQLQLRTLAVPKANNLVALEKLVSKAMLSEVAAHQVSISPQTATVKQMVAPSLLKNVRQQIGASPMNVAQSASKPVASPALQASTMAVLLDNSYSQTVKSKKLTVSFEYCIVQVERPWFSHALLQTRGWYVPGYKAGEFSNGKTDNNGLFPALPIAFIVVKDLQISGWTQDEYEYIKNSVSLGPLSLINRQLTETTLSWSGMQIIGWISQVMPMIPPLSAPL